MLASYTPFSVKGVSDWALGLDYSLFNAWAANPLRTNTMPRIRWPVIGDPEYMTRGLIDFCTMAKTLRLHGQVFGESFDWTFPVGQQSSNSGVGGTLSSIGDPLTTDKIARGDIVVTTLSINEEFGTDDRFVALFLTNVIFHSNTSPEYRGIGFGIEASWNLSEKEFNSTPAIGEGEDDMIWSGSLETPSPIFDFKGGEISISPSQDDYEEIELTLDIVDEFDDADF